MRVKGNQTNITDSTLLTMQLNYTPTYNLHHIIECNTCVCVCVRACERARACVRACTPARVCGCACSVCTCVCVIVHMCVRSCACEAVLILYAIFIRPRHTSQLFIIIF